MKIQTIFVNFLAKSDSKLFRPNQENERQDIQLLNKKVTFAER